MPERPDRAGERAGGRRPLRALRRRGRVAQTWSSGSSASRLRRRAARRLRRARAGPSDDQAMQRNWIGRSEGAELALRDRRSSTSTSRVFTTRPDTLFGATFFVLAPEHPLVDAAHRRPPHGDEVRDVRARTRARAGERARWPPTREDRRLHRRYATNPVNGARVPIWIADYVLWTTAPARSWPCRRTTSATSSSRRRTACRSCRSSPPAMATASRRRRSRTPATGGWSTRPSSTACPRRGEERRSSPGSSERGRGRPAVNYRLRDWRLLAPALLGLPDPDRLLRATAASCPCPRTSCPCCCPTSTDFRPTGEPPLASNEECMNVDVPAAAASPARREADTMDTFVDSSWYFLRYCDPHNDAAPFDRASSPTTGCPVDQYIGGIEHAMMHLLYARFFIKVLNDLGLVGFREPFQRLFHQGWVRQGGAKMSKSRGNVDRARRTGRAVRRRRGPALHPLHGACGPGHRVERRRHRGHLALPAPALARRGRGGRGGAVEDARRPGARRARRTRRSRASPTTSAAASSSTRRSPR